MFLSYASINFQYDLVHVLCASQLGDEGFLDIPYDAENWYNWKASFSKSTTRWKTSRRLKGPLVADRKKEYTSEN